MDQLVQVVFPLIVPEGLENPIYPCPRGIFILDHAEALAYCKIFESRVAAPNTSSCSAQHLIYILILHHISTILLALLNTNTVSAMLITHIFCLAWT